MLELVLSCGVLTFFGEVSLSLLRSNIRTLRKKHGLTLLHSTQGSCEPLRGPPVRSFVKKPPVLVLCFARGHLRILDSFSYCCFFVLSGNICLPIIYVLEVLVLSPGSHWASLCPFHVPSPLSISGPNQELFWTLKTKQNIFYWDIIHLLNSSPIKSIQFSRGPCRSVVRVTPLRTEGWHVRFQ